MSKKTITVRSIEGATDLHHKYPGQTNAQRCHVELDCRTGDLSAEYDAEIGNAVPVDVHNRHRLRWRIACLRADAANALLADVVPLAARVVAGYSRAWDGRNHVATFTPDATAATEEIAAVCESADGPTVNVVSASEFFGVLGSKAVQARTLGITSGSTDEELAVIAARELANADEIDELEGVDAYLDGLRAHARNEVEAQLAEVKPRVVRWQRTDRSDGASEILTLVRVDGREGLAVEVCSGPNVGDDVVGLFDLDGDALNAGVGTWSAVDEAEVTPEQIAAIGERWGSRTNRVERLP